jgi:hypothetical protein
MDSASRGRPVKFSVSSLCAGLAEFVDPALVARLAPMGDVLIPEQEIGRVMAGCLVEDGARLAAECHLSEVLLAAPGVLPRTITPDEAEAHPLFAGHIGTDLADALRAPVMAGATLIGLIPSAPNYERIELVERGHEIRGVAVISFSGVAGHLSVIARYGALDDDPARTTTHRLDGGALYMLGRQAAGVTQATSHDVPEDVAAATPEAVRH